MRSVTPFVFSRERETPLDEPGASLRREIREKIYYLVTLDVRTRTIQKYLPHLHYSHRGIWLAMRDGRGEESIRTAEKQTAREFVVLN